MSFLLSLIFSVQQNWRRGQNRFCPEARGWGGREGYATEGKDGPNVVFTYE
jgi:hypothetical protein